MMIQPTPRMVELLEEFDKTSDEEKREKIVDELRREAEKQDEELKDCPFAH